MYRDYRLRVGQQNKYGKTVKVTPVQRDEIRRRQGEGEDPKDLAKEFGLTVGYVKELTPY